MKWMKKQQKKYNVIDFSHHIDLVQVRLGNITHVHVKEKERMMYNNHYDQVQN